MIGILPWLLGSTLVFMGANTVLKLYAQNGGLPVLAGALALFCLGNLLMVPVMRAGGLGLGLALSVIFQLVGVMIVAFAVFGERPGTLQWAGAALGVVAVVLIAWPQGGST